MARTPSGSGGSGAQPPVLQLDSAADQALKELTRSIETANRNARSAGAIGASRALDQGAGQLPADVLQLVMAAATTAAARAPGGGAGQKVVAERAARQTVDSYNRVLSVRSAAERHSVGLVGPAREAVEAAARRAGAGVSSGSLPDVDRAANRAAEKTAKAYTSGLMASQEKLDERAGAFHKLGMHGLGGSMSQVGQAGSALHDLGMSKAGAMLSKAAGPIAVAMQVAGAVKTVAGVAHDEYLTPGQQNRSLIKGLVPGGETALDWIDTVSGRKRAMARADEEGSRGEIRAQSAIETERTKYQYGSAIDSARIRADVMAKSRPTLMPYIDRSTAAGEKQYELASRLAPVQERIAKANRESEIASRATTAAQERENSLTADGVKLNQEAAELRKRIGPATDPAQAQDGIYSSLRKKGDSRVFAGLASFGGGAMELAMSTIGYDKEYRDAQRKRGQLKVEESAEGPERQRLLHAHSNKLAELQGNQQNRLSAAHGTREAQERQAHAAAELKRAEAGKARVMSDWYGSQADTAENTAVGLALMDPGERENAKWALDEIRKNPSAVLDDPSLAHLAMKIAPKEARAILKQQGQKTQEYQQGMAEGLVDMPGLSEDLRKKQNEEANKASEGEFEADQGLSESLANTIAPAFEKALKIIEEQLRTMLEEFENKLRLSRSSA